MPFCCGEAESPFRFSLSEAKRLGEGGGRPHLAAMGW